MIAVATLRCVVIRTFGRVRSLPFVQGAWCRYGQSIIVPEAPQGNQFVRIRPQSMLIASASGLTWTIRSRPSRGVVVPRNSIIPRNFHVVSTSSSGNGGFDGWKGFSARLSRIPVPRVDRDGFRIRAPQTAAGSVGERVGSTEKASEKLTSALFLFYDVYVRVLILMTIMIMPRFLLQPKRIRG